MFGYLVAYMTLTLLVCLVVFKLIRSRLEAVSENKMILISFGVILASMGYTYAMLKLAAPLYFPVLVELIKEMAEKYHLNL